MQIHKTQSVFPMWQHVRHLHKMLPSEETSRQTETEAVSRGHWKLTHLLSHLKDLYLVVFCVFAACFSIRLRFLTLQLFSKCCKCCQIGCFLTLLVFSLYACVFLNWQQTRFFALRYHYKVIWCLMLWLQNNDTICVWIHSLYTVNLTFIMQFPLPPGTKNEGWLAIQSQSAFVLTLKFWL